MCGICGMSWDDPVLAKRMNKAQRHRGPDDDGIFSDGKVTLGHVRLSIIDLTSTGHQPMASQDGKTLIVFNGEIYNFKDVRRELERKGHRFRGTSDTEVILAAYAQWGEGCFAHLQGMWALALYDTEKKRIVLSRDRYGQKPLYYTITRQGLLFASELKSLLAAGVKPDIDQDGLKEFFTYRYTTDHTMIAGVRKLDPGTSLVYDLSTKKMTVKEYYLLKEEHVEGTVAQLEKELFTRLDHEVERHLIADVPVGFFLSGGIDSSAVVALAAKRLTKEARTFSVGFETTNELSFARIASDAIGTKHQEIIIDDKSLEAFPDIVWHMDEPITDPGFLPNYFLAKEARKKVTVALAGEGADEAFGGYDKYKLLHYGRKAAWLRPPLGGEIGKRLRLMAGKPEKEQYLAAIRLFTPTELQALGIGPSGNTTAYVGKDDYTRMQSYDFRTLIPNDFCMKSDKMAMAHGLETRNPFLSPSLVEFGLGLPREHKLRLWEEKWLLKRTMRDILPRTITSRRKHGFNVPINHWFHGPLKERFEQLLDERDHQLYSKDAAGRMLERFQRTRQGERYGFLAAEQLYGLLTFEEWHKRVIG